MGLVLYIILRGLDFLNTDMGIPYPFIFMGIILLYAIIAWLAALAEIRDPRRLALAQCAHGTVLLTFPLIFSFMIFDLYDIWECVVTVTDSPMSLGHYLLYLHVIFFVWGLTWTISGYRRSWGMFDSQIFIWCAIKAGVGLWLFLKFNTRGVFDDTILDTRYTLNLLSAMGSTIVVTSVAWMFVANTVKCAALISWSFIDYDPPGYEPIIHIPNFPKGFPSDE